jgi:hypothetical protein
LDEEKNQFDKVFSLRCLALLPPLLGDFQTRISEPELRVNCGSTYRATKPGDSFECKLLQKGKSDTVLVRIELEGKLT